MADPYDPANPGNDPLRSADDNYQNLGGLPYANMDPNAPHGTDVPPPPTAQAPPLVQESDKAPSSKKPVKGGNDMVGSGVQELPDSDPSDSRNYRVDKPKVKKLKKKIKRVKIVYWIMIVLWVIALVLFVLIHLNTFGIHVLPFLQKD
ncbi:Protein CBG22203 [Caenorhabditis briggsae]|uniref:Protein CBG22202 n=2 Tax=Caenorhabditis briggsae TaxID=6238 RepID=G2J723_CAEBR|nr:Protein CBG22202 [Caenorhabditis briggsae]XP_002638964.1 Protein CBG22203 [Caenorhabditis briggsae]ULU09770.1 hypothetical protein L3Y34_014268 [Caenorhabditis briggsae]CAP38843.1 Protein CBG22202 [Caenorhabditis briggsae]CAP38844.1 Protein CBG22203 [Caenorhabditis briggsae]